MFGQKLLKSFFKADILVVCFLLCGAGFLSSCDLAKNYQKPDRGSNMEIQDFRDGLAERIPEVDSDDHDKSKSMASIPSIQPYVSTSTTNMKPMPLVSVSVNQSVPIKDVLYELANQANYDLELDPNIHGSIIFTARDKPFDVVIDRISKIAGLRYTFKDGFLRVEQDTPYNKIYKIDYLSFVRNNSGAVSTSVSVVSGDGADTGSNFSASSESNSDFWGELETNLKQILGGETTGALKTRKDPHISAVEKNPDVAAVAPAPKEDEEGKVQVQPPEAVLHVDSLPVDGEQADSGKSSGAAKKGGNDSTFTINKQAGVISVYGTDRQQQEVQKYLDVVRKSVTAQVLIEAKIFEVGLKDEYITGIDWNAIGLSAGEGFAGFMNSNGKTAINSMLSNPGTSVFSAPTGSALGATSNVVIGYAGNNVQALLQAISSFGTVRALASPRLTVLNNQSAVLNVATNRVFFKIDLTRQEDTDTHKVTVDINSETKSVPEGVLVNVQPSINLDNGTVSMSVRPTITRVTGVVNDPGVAFIAATIDGAQNLQSEVPEVNVQEIDTVVKVRSGQAIVMGGLLQDRSDNSQEGIPVLGEVPLLGGMFRKKNDLVSKSELVIFLKATILNSPEDSVDNTDRDLYKAFSGDRRPTKL